MAKKTNSKRQSKKLRRTSSMLEVIAQGEQFLSQNKKKKSPRTKTMTETIKDAQNIISKTRSTQKGKDNGSVKKKIITKKAIKRKASRKATSGKNPKGKAPKSDKPTASKKTISFKSAIPSILATGNMKKTIFKTKSNENLPIPAYGFIDVCFCIDATGSMSSELSQVQSTILSIIQKISSKVSTQGLTLRFAIVTYRDHPPQETSYVTKVLDFTDGHQASQYVQKLEAFGGGDFPEAVHDGLMTCCKQLRWVELTGVPILRYIFHIADAPPHGKEFGQTYEANQGCLCGMRIQDVYNQINKRQIHYRLIKCREGNQLTDMQNKFKNGINDFNSTSLNNAKQLNIRVSDMIICQVLPVTA